jgi:hypothetical protein
MSANKQNQKDLSPEAQLAYQREADQAMEMAMKIATKHGVDLASVSEKEFQASKEAFANEVIDKSNKNVPHESYVVSLIQSHFRVKTVTGFHISFVGKTSDVVLAKFLYFFLLEEFIRRWKTYYTTHKVHNRYAVERKRFLYGVMMGLHRKLTEAKKAAEEEGLTETSGAKHIEIGVLKKNYSLMVVTEEESLNNALGEYFPKLKKGKIFKMPTGQKETLKHGFEAGQRINIPGAPLENAK